MTNIKLKIKAGVTGLVLFTILLIISVFANAQRIHFVKGASVPLSSEK